MVNKNKNICIVIFIFSHYFIGHLKSTYLIKEAV